MRRFAIAATAAVFLGIAGTAEAKVFQGSVSDPQGDVQPNLPGDDPFDIKRVSVRYDQGRGRLKFVFRGYALPSSYLVGATVASDCSPGGDDVSVGFDFERFLAVNTPSGDFALSYNQRIEGERVISE